MSSSRNNTAPPQNRRQKGSHHHPSSSTAGGGDGGGGANTKTTNRDDQRDEETDANLYARLSEPLSDLQRLRLSSIEKLNELVLNNANAAGENASLGSDGRETTSGGSGMNKNASLGGGRNFFRSTSSDDSADTGTYDNDDDVHNGSYDSSPGSDEYDEANEERMLRQRLRLEAANNQSKKEQLKEKLESLLSLDQAVEDDTMTELDENGNVIAKSRGSSDLLSNTDTNSSNESSLGSSGLNAVENNQQETPNTPTTTAEGTSLDSIPTQMPKFMIWLPTVPSKEGTLEKYTEIRGNWFSNLMRGFGSSGRNDASWKLRHFVLYDNHLFWGKGFSRMYGYGTVLAARDAFEYGQTAIAIDLLLYPKKSSRHGSSSTSTPQSLVEALTGACCRPEGYSHKIVRCETLKDKALWLEVLNRTAAMHRERAEKEQQIQEQREHEQQKQRENGSNPSNQRKAITNENSAETTGYAIQPPSPRISSDDYQYGSKESKRFGKNKRESRDYFARTDGDRHQQHQLSPTVGSPSITTDEESEESELESDEYDDDDVFNDNDDDSEYVENGRNRMHGGASSSGLKTHASMLKHNDSEDSLSLDPQNGIPPSTDDRSTGSPASRNQPSSRGLVRTGSGSVRFRNRSLSPAPNQRSPGSTPRSARAAQKQKNGVFTSSPRSELVRTSSSPSIGSKKPPPVSSPSGATKYSAAKPPFDPNARPKQSSMKRSAIHSAFSAAQQKVLDDANKITEQQQKEGESGMSTPPPHNKNLQNVNSPRTTGGSKKSVTFQNDALLEEVKKYDATPTNGKKKKKSHMFQNNISASAWAEQLERRSSRALIKAAGSWSISINDLIFGKKIGIGSFGKVYKAKWHGTNVAVKKTLDVATHNTIKEFAAEIRLMRDLRHPNIVLFLGAVVDAPSMCIVTELMKRGNLHSILHDYDNVVRETVADNGRLRLQMATDCARGMSYLHSRSPPIVHHDLKPANLLVDSKWNLKISDFGMSRIKYRAYLQKSNPELETAGGTPEWMSPEALRNDNVDELSDVYSFGIILWELITLNYPWHELKDPVQIVGKVAFLHHRPKIPSWVETEMEELLLDCWSRDSCDRPEFVRILELLQTVTTPGAWSLGKGDNALEVKRSKFSQYLQDEHLEAAVNAQDEPERNSFFGFGGTPSRSKESGSLTSVASSQYKEADDPYIPGENERVSLYGDNDSDLSGKGQSKSSSTGGIPGHKRRESHENILAFRPHSLTGLTIKTPAPKPDGKEHDRPDDKGKGLGGLKIRIENKRTSMTSGTASGMTSTTTAARSATAGEDNNTPKNISLEELVKLDDDLDDDLDVDEDEDDDEDDEDLESEVSGFSQLSEAQQQKMNKFKEQQIKLKNTKNKGMSKLSEEAPSGKEEEEQEQPKTPRKMSSLFSDDDDDTKGAEERVGEEGLEARETAFPSRSAPDAYGSGTGGKKKKKKKKSDEKPKEPSEGEERSKPMFASQL